MFLRKEQKREEKTEKTVLSRKGGLCAELFLLLLMSGAGLRLVSLLNRLDPAQLGQASEELT